MLSHIPRSIQAHIAQSSAHMNRTFSKEMLDSRTFQIDSVRCVNNFTKEKKKKRKKPFLT